MSINGSSIYKGNRWSHFRLPLLRMHPRANCRYDSLNLSVPRCLREDAASAGRITYIHTYIHTIHTHVHAHHLAQVPRRFASTQNPKSQRKHHRSRLSYPVCALNTRKTSEFPCPSPPKVDTLNGSKPASRTPLPEIERHTKAKGSNLPLQRCRSPCPSTSNSQRTLGLSATAESGTRGVTSMALVYRWAYLNPNSLESQSLNPQP